MVIFNVALIAYRLENPHDIEKAVNEGMAKKDKSAPKTEDDFEEAKPVTNKKTSKK